MAVIDERYRSARDVGGPALGHYLGAFMKEREAMNAEATPDLSNLVAAEADARDRIARLRERQAMLRGKKEELSVRSSDKAAELKTKILVANIAAGAKTTTADRQFRLGMQKLYSDRAEGIAKKMEIPNEAASVIESATAPTTATVDTRAARRSAMEKAKANEGTQEADVIDHAIWKGLVARDAITGTNDAVTYAGEHFGRDGDVVVDPNEYMYRMYSVKSPKEAEDDAKRVSKAIGGSGGDPNLVDGWLKDGSLPSVESETQTRERSSGPVDPEQADALEKAIGDLTNYADGLAAQRSAAGSRRYPKGHSFLLNPNTFTEQEGWDALDVYSENTAGYNEEVGAALAKAGGDPRKAYAALASQGGSNDDRGRDYAPDLVDDGLDISKWLVGEVEKVSKPLVVKDGEWTYEVKDGTVTITTAPAANKGAVGKTYTAEKDKDSPVFKKIADHINKSPELAERAQARKALEAQPAGVRRLFTGVFELADTGRYDEAKRAANDVSSDDVRFAYGEALQEDPGAAANGIRALPEDVLGTAGESVLRALDAPSKTPIDVAAIQGNLRGLGGALLVAQDPERVARKNAQAEQDRAGTYEMRTGGRKDDPPGRMVKESQYSRGLPTARVDPAPPQEGKPKSRMASAGAPIALGWATDMNVVPGDDTPPEDSSASVYDKVGFLQGEISKHEAQPAAVKAESWWKDRRLALSRDENLARAAAGGTSVDTDVTLLLDQLDKHEQIPEAERDPRWWGKTKDALRTRLEKEQDLAQKKRGSLPPPAPDEFDDFDAFMETDLGGSK